MDPSSLLLAVVATVLLVGVAHVARRWLEFRTLARALGGTGAGRGFAATTGGVAYRCRYSGGSRRSRSSQFSVAVDLASGAPFRIARAGVGTRLCVALGMGRTVPTGDPGLDQTHLVACDAADWVARVFGDGDATAAAREILANGFTELRADGRSLTAVWRGGRTTGDVDASAVSATVRRLARLRDAVAAMPAPPDAAAGGRRRILAVVPVVVFTVGWVLVTWATTFTPLDARAVGLDSLKLSLPWLALFLVVGTQVFRLSTTSPRELMRIVLLALLGFPIAGFGTELTLNGALDAAPPVEHRVVVLDRGMVQGRWSPTYWAVVRSWRGAHGECTCIRITASEYARLVPKRSELLVTTRPGRLGFEWIVASAVVG